ncbi:MAG: hypothetical protein AB9873_05775 [Syntrophobacteraceae bacterium]
MRSVFANPHPAAIAIGLLLSPESLTKLGNGIGQSGAHFLWLIAFTALAYLANAWSYDRLQHFLQGTTVESYPLGSLLGRRGSHLLPLVTRLPAFVCYGTAVLATAGFVFNEVFVYWFPNFAFAFLLLGLLLVVCLITPRAALMLQSIFSGVAIAGLIALIVAGFAGWSKAPLPETMATGALGMRPAILCLMLFMGFELAIYGPPARVRHYPVSRFVVAALAVLFLLWTVVSIHFVPLQNLVESSLPHMLTARSILGETGRGIMGIVVLAGCCGVVNGSLLAMYGLASDLLRFDERDDSTPGKWITPGRIGILLLAGGMAVALASGQAGEPELEVWLRGSALLWLLGYAVFHLALCVLTFHGPPAGRASAGLFQNRGWGHAALLLLFFGLVVASVWTEPEKAHLLAFMLVAPLASCIILLAWRRVTAGRNGLD